MTIVERELKRMKEMKELSHKLFTEYKNRIKKAKSEKEIEVILYEAEEDALCRLSNSEFCALEDFACEVLENLD